MFEGPPKDRAKIGEVLKIRFADRFPRVKAIGDHVKVGAFKEKKEVTVSKPLQELWAQIMANARVIEPTDDSA